MKILIYKSYLIILNPIQCFRAPDRILFTQYKMNQDQELLRKLNNHILFYLSDVCYTYAKSVSLPKFVEQILIRTRANYLSTIGIFVILTRVKKNKINPKMCNRRLFLAAVMANHRMIYDKTLSYQKWSRITGLSKEEIKKNFNEFIKFIDYNLHVKYEEYIKVDTIVKANLDFRLIF
jgi:hypothetical protein